MVRGKYAAKAANRAAALDNEVIIELRAKLAAANQDRADLIAKLNTAERKLVSDVNALVQAAIADERESLAAERQRMTEQFNTERRHAANLFATFVREWIKAHEQKFGEDFVMPVDLISDGNTEHSVVGILRRLDNENGGELVATLWGDDPMQGRASRRRTAAQVDADIRRRQKLESNHCKYVIKQALANEQP